MTGGESIRSRVDLVVPEDPADRPWITRRGVRVLLVDDGGAILLFEDSDPGLPDLRWWVTPGGGIDPGESDLQAAVREVAEETGCRLQESDLVGPLAVRQAVHGYSDQVVDQTESFYLARVPRFEVDTAGHTEEELITLQQHRWWPRAELESTDAWLWPTQLVELCDRGLAGAIDPLDFGRHTDESTRPVA